MNAEGTETGRPRVLFVTGRLAEYALRRVLERLAPEVDFEPEVAVLNIAVAGLMTAEWVARRLRVPEGTSRVVLPGYCRGDLECVRRAAGVEVVRGPRDLRELPRWFGRSVAGAEYGDYDIEILAEVNNAPSRPLEDVLAEARHYRESGADWIDVGCDTGSPSARTPEIVRALRGEGFRVSVDSMNPGEIEAAVEAGAELVLSVNSKNIDVARGLASEVVLIPDDPRSLAGLEKNAAKLEAWGVPFRLDPILEPIGFGFAASLGRYVEVRRRFPEAPMLMGIGNLTELTDADTAPINVLLLGFCEELRILSVLTTEVIHWARSAVKECDIARRLVHYAWREKTLPKHVEPRLHILRDEEVPEFGEEVLARIQAGLRDRNFRIYAEGGLIHVLNSEGWRRGRNPFALFRELGVADPEHAFYLGYEMAKAATALALGKAYVQDQALRWGFLTVEEEGSGPQEIRPGGDEEGGHG